jgi:predicted DCC family thiol-disulfide oxidoreductase YuxK
MSQNDRIVFFDGVCNLCNGLVKFIIRMDRKELIKFSALQSEAARETLKNKGVDSDQLTSVAYLSGGIIYFKSSAILHVFKDTGGILKGFYLFILLPRFLRDAIYNFIADHRYKIFGRRDSCMIPDDKISGRFL